MDWRRFPRPNDDTGIGGHSPPDWQDRYELAVLPRIHEMGWRWYAMLVGSNEPATHGNVRTIREAGLEIILRIQPSDPLTGRGKYYVNDGGPLCTFPVSLIKVYTDVGVKYFRTGNEPYQLYEWVDAAAAGACYPDRLTVLVDLLIDFELRNAANIRAAGGIPVLSDLGSYIDHGHLMTYESVWRRAQERGVLTELYPPGELTVQGMHDRPINRPPDYPYNMPEGYRDWPHPQNTWVNDRAYCYNEADLILELMEHFGIGHVALMATEAGYEIGWKQDKRFPPISDPQHHAAMNVALARYQQSRKRYPVFCSCFWHLHRRKPEPFWRDGWFENEAHGGGELPVVQAFVDAQFPPARDQLLAAEPTPEPGILELWKELRHTAQWYPLRPLENIEWLVVHQTVGDPPPNDLASQIAWCKRLNEWFIEGRRWPGFGYPFVIFPDGRVIQTAPLDRATYHCGVKDDRPGAIEGLDENAIASGFAFAGTFSDRLPTDEALAAGRKLIDDLWRGLPNVTRVIGHSEVPGAAVDCPGRPVVNWLRQIYGGDDLTKLRHKFGLLKGATAEALGNAQETTAITIEGTPLREWLVEA